MPPSTEPNEREAPKPPVASSEVSLGVAVTTEPGKSGTVTARGRAGCATWAWRSTRRQVGVKAALQHLAKAVNIAFQTDFGENFLESVYQAAIVRHGEVHDRPPGVLRLRRGLVRPVRPADPLAATDPRRPRPGLARGTAADRREGRLLDPRSPQPHRPQARPGRRVRGPRPSLCRADVRPARSVGHHRRLGSARLGDLDHAVGLDIRIAPKSRK